jgi:uncharacterized membrane protein
MESRLKVLGHPVHPMLVMFPLGLLVTAFFFDLVDVLGGPDVLGEVAYWNITVGLAVGVLAAAAGVVDLLAVPHGTRAKRVAVVHGLVNAGVVILFAGAWVVRTGADSRAAGGALLAIELVALGGLAAGAWLGGELVDRLGVGVDPDAHLDAPSSLRPASRGQFAPAASRPGPGAPGDTDPADPAADRELHHPDTGRF